MQQIPDWARALISPLDDKLGFELVELSAERVVGRIPVEGNQQPLGLLHGGATGTLVETLSSLGASLHAHELGRVAVGTDLHVTHLAAARTGHVTGTATPLRLGRRVAVHRVEVCDDEGRATAFGTLTCQLIEGDRG